MRRYLKYVCAAVALCGLQAAVAHADTLDLFTFSLNGLPGSGSAIIPASPTPSSFVLGTSFTVSNVTVSYLGNTFTGDVTFYDAGGASADGNIFGGDQLYTGPDNAPTFRIGNFNLQGIVDLGSGPMGQTIGIDLTSYSGNNMNMGQMPEPGTLAMVGTAALGFAPVVRRRFL